LVEDLFPNENDKQFEVVLEAIRETAVRLQNDMNNDFDVRAVLTQQQKILAENEDFRERISRLAAEMELLKLDKGSKEESGSGKKDEARGSKEESNHKVMQCVFQVCTSVDNENVYVYNLIYVIIFLVLC
jgi:hypothetical protein